MCIDIHHTTLRTAYTTQFPKHAPTDTRPATHALGEQTDIDKDRSYAMKKCVQINSKHVAYCMYVRTHRRRTQSCRQKTVGHNSNTFAETRINSNNASVNIRNDWKRVNCT